MYTMFISFLQGEIPCLTTTLCFLQKNCGNRLNTAQIVGVSVGDTPVTTSGLRG